MKLLKFDCIDSTNTYGKANFDTLDDKTVIIANEQTKGRGRFNRVWVSKNCENIYLSLVLKPQNTKYITNLTQYMSVVSADVLKTYNVQPQIKWPNDVLVNNKKICGILSEGVIKNNQLSGIVLGIGINLNMDDKTLNSIDRPATSLNIETGKQINKEEFLKKLIDSFFENYNNAMQNGFEYFKNDYLKYVDFLGKTVFIQQRDNDKKEQYIAKNIDNQGNLVVLDSTNKEKIIYSGDLIY